MLCVPKIYVPIPTCLLRVVDNDSGEEVKRVFQRVAPHVYKKNKVSAVSSLILNLRLRLEIVSQFVFSN